MTAELRFFVQGNDGNGVRKIRAYKGDIQPAIIDFAPFEDITGVSFTNATAELISGTATFEGEAFASSAWQARLGTPEFGRSLLKITAAGGNYAKVIYLDIRARNEEVPATGGIWGD